MAELIKAEFQIRPRGVSVFGICRTPTHDNGGGGCPQAGVLAAWGGAVDKHLLLEGRSCGWLAALRREVRSGKSPRGYGL